MEHTPSEENRREENTSAPVMQYAPQRTANPYILPASILIAAVMISGSIVYMVNSGAGATASKKPVNPLTLPYKGPKTAFSECLDSEEHIATAQADNAAGAEAGVNSTPTTFINGKKVVDATGKSVGASGQAVVEAIEAAIKKPTPEPKTGPMALTPRDIILGNPDAKITVVEYGDYQCPFCELYHAQVFPVIQKDYVNTGKVKFVFRDFPFLGQESIDAGAAVECAKDLGKFWEYHAAVYEAKTEDAQKYGGGENDGFLNRNTFLNLWQRVAGN